MVAVQLTFIKWLIEWTSNHLIETEKWSEKPFQLYFSERNLEWKWGVGDTFIPFQSLGQ